MVQYSLLLMSMSADVSPYVCADYFIYVLPFGKELLTRLTMCSLCIKGLFVIYLFPVWFSRQEFGYECNSSWSLLTFYFL